MRKSISLVAAATLGALSLLVSPHAATAVDLPGGRLVSEVAAAGTPHVLDGSVLSVVQVGDLIVLGGNFTSARNDDSQTTLPRKGVLAFSATTGKISTTFNPSPNGVVNVVLPASDGTSVYVGGNYTAIGGVTRKNLVKVSLSDGAVDTRFNTASVAGQVKDLRLADGRLWVGGAFTHIANQAQLGLATVHPDTGAFLPFMRSAITGTHNGGYPTVVKFDITPDGSRLVAIGNFDKLDGVTNHQLFMLDLTGAAARQANFQSSFYTDPCSRNFNSYVRDIDIAPDGKFFVVSTTGAFGGATAETACDTTARFEVGATGNGVAPSWVNTTGGDTTHGIEVTDSVVYAGGHQRWQNNPFAGDRAGPGAVSRPGLAALDPTNGLPFSWNPTRDRGVGVFDFLETSQGLWLTSDTDRIGDYQYKGRVALLPPTGKQFPAITTPTLPNDIYVAGSSSTNAPIVKRSFQNSTAGSDVTVPSGDVSWSNVRGAFMVNGTLYTAMADGTFSRRTFDGTTYGASALANTQDLIVPLTDWATDVKTVTGMFLDSGRLYFTKSGQSQLFYRYFNPESDVVGARRYVASSNVTGINFSTVTGMFSTGDKLYWSTSDNVLRSIDWVNGARAGAPVAGTATAVSGAGIDNARWSSRALFLYQGAGGTDAGPVPAASFTSECTARACSFDATGSTATGGSLTSYSWTFGDGSTATGATPTHTYAANGTYTVDLTVTANNGVTDSATGQVTVTDVVSGTITQVGANSTNGNRTNHSVAIPAATQAGDAMVAFLTTNDSSVTINAPAGWTPIESRDGAGILARAWTKTATAADLSSNVSATTSAGTKSDLSIAVYRGTGTTSVTASASAIESGSTTAHMTPGVTVSKANSWVVSYWARKTSNASTWAVPGGQSVRTSSNGVGGGNIAAVLTDGNGGQPAGSAGALTASTSDVSTQVSMFSVVIGAGEAATPPPPVEPDPEPEPEPEPEPAAAVLSPVAATSVNGNRATHSVPVPSATQVGDALVVLMTANDSTVTLDASEGWTLVQTQDSPGVLARAWSKTATAGDLNTSFVVNSSGYTKADLSIAVYRAESGSATVTASSSVIQTGTSIDHTTPAVDVPAAGSWLVSYWARKSGASTFSAPEGQSLRTSSTGTGGGNITAILTDGNAPQSAGAAGGLTATTSGAAGNVAMFSLVIGQK